MKGSMLGLERLCLGRQTSRRLRFASGPARLDIAIYNALVPLCHYTLNCVLDQEHNFVDINAVRRRHTSASRARRGPVSRTPSRAPLSSESQYVTNRILLTYANSRSFEHQAIAYWRIDGNPEGTGTKSLRVHHGVRGHKIQGTLSLRSV